MSCHMTSRTLRNEFCRGISEWHTTNAMDCLGQDDKSGDIEQRKPPLNPVERRVEEGLKLVSALLRELIQGHKGPHDHEHACNPRPVKCRLRKNEASLNAH